MIESEREKYQERQHQLEQQTQVLQWELQQLQQEKQELPATHSRLKELNPTTQQSILSTPSTEPSSHQPITTSMPSSTSAISTTPISATKAPKVQTIPKKDIKKKKKEKMLILRKCYVKLPTPYQVDHRWLNGNKKKNKHYQYQRLHRLYQLHFQIQLQHRGKTI